MASVGKHVLVTFGGTMGTGTSAEIWQCGIKMSRVEGANVFADNLADLTAYLNSIKTGVQTWWSGSGNLCRQDFLLTWIKASNISGGAVGKGQPGGKVSPLNDIIGGPNPAVTTFTGIAGGATPTGFNVPPPFVTLAVTLRDSTKPRGPRRVAAHGRVYIPFRVDSGGTSRVSNPGPFGTSVGVLLTTLSKTGVAFTDNGGATSSLKPVLCGNNGSLSAVNQISTGDVVDTIRRRKDKLREVYTDAAWS